MALKWRDSSLWGRLIGQKTTGDKTPTPIARDAFLQAPLSPCPLGTDWSWRPEVFQQEQKGAHFAPAPMRSELSAELALYHDCKAGDLQVQQTPADAPQTPPFAISASIKEFTGSYLSFVVEVPEAACAGLERRHLIRLAADISTAAPTPLYARLNVRHGPNTEQILLTLPAQQGPSVVEFDLAYCPMVDGRAERTWIDIFVAQPRMNTLTIHDIVLCRFPRAEI